MRTRSNKVRFYIVFFLFVCFFLLLAARLCYLQIACADRFKKLARSQHHLCVPLPSKRGIILDRNGYELATTYNLYSMYANPRMIVDKGAYVQRLAPILSVGKHFLRDRLDRDKGFVWIKRKVDLKTAEQIRAMKLTGIGFVKEPKRAYPLDRIASHLIGCVDIDNKGLEGMELVYNEQLSGEDGWLVCLRDAKQREVFFADFKRIAPVDGCDLELTIDQTIQFIAEREIEKAYVQYRAKGATVIVMDPYTGEILALANRPSYDLNDINASSREERRNRAITDIFEPGSVFKIFTASAVLEEKALRLTDVLDCENGRCNFGGRILNDHRPHGRLSFQEVIEVSSNIGTVKAAMKLGKEKFHKYIRAFGFGDQTGIGLPGEARGLVRPLSEWSGYSMSSIPMGQEIGVTAIQLAAAVGAIAHDGVLMRPYLVRKIQRAGGTVIKEYKPTIVRRVISEATAATVREVMEGVIERGTGQSARLGEYTAGGKTGTSQKLEPDGRYSHSKFVASFVGFAPRKNPRIVIVVSVDEPHGSYYGGVVAAPVFKNIANDVLRYLGVEADKAAGSSTSPMGKRNARVQRKD